MRSLPKISIVTPSYNQAEYLEDTIKSVLDQGYRNLEYVIIDGGSTDDSPKIIEKYSDYLKYWVSEKDNGHADAINKGFSKTTGEIMAWLNSDDMYLPWTFEVVSQIFVQFPEVNWIQGFTSKWNKHGHLIDAKRNLINKYDYLLGNYRWIQQESVFWRRNLWEKAGGYIDTSYEFMVDGQLWSRFFQFEDLYILDSIISGYRIHGTNRAALFSNDCTLEMNKIIESMTKSISADILKDFKTFRKIQKLFFFNNLLKRTNKPINTALRPFFRNTYQKASYNVIYSNRDGEWKIKKMKFRVR